jgi:hypothetical protein
MLHIYNTVTNLPGGYSHETPLKSQTSEKLGRTSNRLDQLPRIE